MNEKKHSSIREKRLNVAEELVSHKKNSKQAKTEATNLQATNFHVTFLEYLFVTHREREREERGEEGEKGRGEKLVRTATDIEIICSLAAFLIIAARSKQKTLATNLKWK